MYKILVDDLINFNSFLSINQYSENNDTTVKRVGQKYD